MKSVRRKLVHNRLLQGFGASKGIKSEMLDVPEDEKATTRTTEQALG